MIDAETVSHSEGRLVREHSALHFYSFKSAAHNGKGPVSALHTVLQQPFIKERQRAEIPLPHSFHDLFIIAGTFRTVTVRPVFLLTVAQIPAGKKDTFPPRPVNSFPDQLSELPMTLQRQAGQTDSYQLIIPVTLVDKIQRNHCPVIQLRIPFSQSACRESCRTP